MGTIARILSGDGAELAVERSGSGPMLVLVGGALSDRATAEPYRRALDRYFTVVAYDRRGRGDSTDPGRYAPEREIEDLTAVLESGHGPRFVYGHSSGAILSLETAMAGASIDRLVVYEPPYAAPDSPVAPGEGLADRLEALVEAGDRDTAVRLFFREGPRVPLDVIDRMQAGPGWEGMRRLAHTLPYDVAIAGNAGPPTGRLANLAVPTLVLVGGSSPNWMRAAGETVASSLPAGELAVVPGVSHNAPPELVAAQLIRFLSPVPGGRAR